MKILRLLGLLVLGATCALADPTPPDPAARLAEYRKLADGLKYQQGEIVLRGGIAKIKLPTEFRYLNPADTETVISKLWGNPPSNDRLGLIVPAGFDPLDSSGYWAVVITYEEDGYVKDNDAAGIDYTKLLAQMKEGMQAANKERQKAGYPSIDLIGWATPPHYDPATHKLYWARELKFGDSPEHTLNYSIRILGRRGVLVLNTVAPMAELKEVETATPSVLAMVDFQEGHRYADFNPSTDKVATYGIAALIAGGILAKAGMFKLLWVGLLAAKKFVVIAILALVGYVKKLLGIKSEKKPAIAAGPPPPAEKV
ncbi:MAG TPA: DUF2167 domain-containing protein [Opitutaceae bacterium]|jgi:uncharacterized membrane-anchored protein|nr:DUF2167 domain-containing protein [Opitutaceae bacterium]